MPPMPLGESDTRSKLIDPALYQRGWTEHHIRREETAGEIDFVDGPPRRKQGGRVDYTLRLIVRSDAQPVAVALIEAKAENLPAAHGLEQGKVYAACKRLNVPFVFSSNGHQFVEYDFFTGQTVAARPLSMFPSPEELRQRYENGKGFSLEDPAAAPLLEPYISGETSRRYYQDAAIRAALEKIAAGKNRVLLSLATGAGKTFIAVNLLKRIADAGQLRRALFLCDRDELRSQGAGAFHNVFGTDAAPVSAGNPQKNARILIATYQTLDVDSADADANFLTTNYPENYFSHILIDECHRSAWGKWSQVLTRNPDAIQIGLTATPRTLEVKERTGEFQADEQLTADNVKHFGEPVYEYDMSQGIEDGYLAACEIIRRDTYLGKMLEVEEKTGLKKADLEKKKLTYANTGEIAEIKSARDHYTATTFEERIVLPDRVRAMSRDLFNLLVKTGGPEQKTIIFCAGDPHADQVAIAMNNLYAEWCAKCAKIGRTGADTQVRPYAQPYAFKCTSESGGSNFLPELRGSSKRYFIATTVELLTTGVDVPIVRNIVFFKYVKSPIAFYQMVGRGTRIHTESGKLMFRVYDYTNATRLFGREFRTKFTPPKKRPQPPGPPPEPVLQVEGFDVRVTGAGRYILAMVDGKAMPVTVEEYRARVAEKLVAEAPTLQAFRSRWIDPELRRILLGALPDEGRSPRLLRELSEMYAFDLYDVLAELGYGLAPRTREERADAFGYKHAKWLRDLPESASATLRALARQFARSGTEALEDRYVFQTPEVRQAGGIPALQALGKPADALRETKERIFAA